MDTMSQSPKKGLAEPLTAFRLHREQITRIYSGRS